MQPTIGRIVLYRLTEQDSRVIAEQAVREGQRVNPHCVGQILPLVVCRVWPNEWGEGVPGVNGQALLDGSGSLWVCSAREGAGYGQWSWPERA